MSAARLAREEETIAFRTSRVASRLGAEGEACEAIGAEPPRRGHRAWMARRGAYPVHRTRRVLLVISSNNLHV